jgi:hypothetical protein
MRSLLDCKNLPRIIIDSFLVYPVDSTQNILTVFSPPQQPRNGAILNRSLTVLGVVRTHWQFFLAVSRTYGIVRNWVAKIPVTVPWTTRHRIQNRDMDWKKYKNIVVSLLSLALIPSPKVSFISLEVRICSCVFYHPTNCRWLVPILIMLDLVSRVVIINAEAASRYILVVTKWKYNII